MTIPATTRKTIGLVAHSTSSSSSGIRSSHSPTTPT